MAAALTGSVLQVQSSGGSITVPADAQAVVAMWRGWTGTNGDTLSTISLGGASSFTLQQNIPEDDSVGFDRMVGVATATISSTGSQTFSYTFPRGLSSGPIFSIFFIKGINTSDWIRATYADSNSGSTAVGGTVASSTTDLVLVTTGDFGTLPGTESGCTSQSSASDPNGYDQVRSQTVDSPGASTTTVNVSSPSYASIGIISIKSSASGVSGTLAKTNANDTLAATGTLTNVGTLAKTNANDTLTATGTLTNVGTLAKTNANDTLAATGTLTNVGSLASTNQNDTLVASGVSGGVSGSVAKSNQNDTLAATGVLTLLGTLAKTNNNDGLVATGTLTLTGSLNRSNQNDIMNAAGTSGNVAPSAPWRWLALVLSRLGQ